ncbi:CTLH C-terminal LisH motif, partial [Trinorchestia longiramus]
MPSAHLTLREEDVIRLSLEFLQNRALHITQLSLERESGVINGNYSDDALFLRQLILDGQWDDALEFVQPLQAMESFNNKKFHFLILKYKYFELLCIKTEAPDSANNEAAVAELVKVLEEVAVYAPSKEAHSQLCLLLTTPQLHQHKLFKDWNPSSARVECWNQSSHFRTSRVTTNRTSKVTTKRTSKVTTKRTSKVTTKRTKKVTTKRTRKVNTKGTSKVTTNRTSKVTTKRTSKVTTKRTRKVFPLVEKYLCSGDSASTPGSNSGDSTKTKTTAKNDRLVQLMIKGLLYESCVEYCQVTASSIARHPALVGCIHRVTVQISSPSGLPLIPNQGQATGASSPVSSPSLQFPPLLAPTTFSDSDLSLLSWLHSIPPDTFACPFEQRTLNVDVERLDKPSLEASWTEQLLVTPIKPRVFPHSAMPYTRPKAADIMSRSLNPGMEGLAGFKSSMIASSGDVGLMSKSIASFHLTGKKTMNTSVDRLFDSDNVFTGSAYGDLPTILEKDSSSLNLSKDLNNLKDTTKRPSTDSLNKPPLTDKGSVDFTEAKEDRTSPRSHSPSFHNSGGGGSGGGGGGGVGGGVSGGGGGGGHHAIAHHQLHHNVSASQPGQSPPLLQNQQAQLQQQHPKHNVVLPMGTPSRSPLPYSPQQPYHPQQPHPGMVPPPYHRNSPQFTTSNNNINSADVTREKTELFSIYQRRQQQNRPDLYGNVNNGPLNANRQLMSGGLSVASEEGVAAPHPPPLNRNTSYQPPFPPGLPPPSPRIFK